MVIDKMLEYFQDLKRYYDDKKWGKFYDNYRNDPDEYEMYDTYFHNSYDDYEEAARDLCAEIREYMDLVWNEIPEDQVKLFDDGEKHNVREWLDETSRMFWNKLDNLSERETYGFLLQGYKMLKWIENAARKTPDEFYGKYAGGQVPYYLGESDKTYKAKASGKWLSGNKLVKDEKDADTFESKTEPTQRLNQMKKDGKLNKNAKITVIDEALKNLFDEILSEAIIDFDKKNHGMYRYAKRKHDETKAIRKVSKEPYWVHPEGVAKIIMEHGGSDIEIKAGMAHDLLEDTGCVYSDLVEKFGEKVASIVKEVTNDKAEIEKVGKERYISEELVRLSPEALTVKLADMLYNMKDSPTESNYKRMRNNVTFLMMNRELSDIHCKLVDEILEV